MAGTVVLGSFQSQARGVMFYSGVVGVCSDICCHLEPANPHDSNAIALFAGGDI